jgi:hypothetical protein
MVNTPSGTLTQRAMVGVSYLFGDPSGDCPNQ